MGLIEKLSGFGKTTSLSIIIFLFIVLLIFGGLGTIYSILWDNKLKSEKPSIEISCNNNFLVTEILAIVFWVLFAVTLGTTLRIIKIYEKINKKESAVAKTAEKIKEKGSEVAKKADTINEIGSAVAKTAEKK
jgi:hypothetical protein